MNDLITYIDKDLMIAAAKNLQTRADSLDEVRVAVYNPMTYESAFGGQGGGVDYPTSYTTGGVTGSGFLFWDGPTYLESETFTVDSNAPWAPDLHEKWDTAIRNRQGETWAITQELRTLRGCILQYLEDTGQVDLENAGLIGDAVEDE